MGHSVHGLIVNDVVADVARARVAELRSTQLAVGLVLIPVTGELSRALGERDDDASRPVGRFNRLSEVVRNLAVELSRTGPVAYIETDYFGGVGEQAAAVWEHGEALMSVEPSDGHPINDALRLLGVRGSAGRDEFDCVGLGRHRSNEAWLEAARWTV